MIQLRLDRASYKRPDIDVIEKYSEILGADAAGTGQYMRMVVDPESPPDVLDHGAAFIVHHCPVLPNEDK